MRDENARGVPKYPRAVVADDSKHRIELRETRLAKRRSEKEIEDNQEP
jgi:hypothetical protein